MPPSKLSLEDSRLIANILRELELSLEQSQNLLEDVRKGEVNFAALQTELRIVCEHNKTITPMIHELMTRVALNEQAIKDLKESKRDNGNDAPDRKTYEEIRLEDTKGKWHFKGLVVGGAFSTLASIIALILAFIK